MRMLFTVLILLIGNVSKAQAPVGLDEVSRHIGDSVVVCGKVAGMRYFANSSNQPTFLNIGADFPNQQLTVVIWGDVRRQFSGNIDDFKGKEICITGRITVYKNRTQIVINHPGEIRLQ